MTEDEFNREIYYQKRERQIKHIDENGALIEDQYRNGDRLFIHQINNIGEEEIEVDLITITHIENESITGIEIVNDFKERLEDESKDTAYGVRIEYCEGSNITRVSRILVNEDLLDGVSTYYGVDGKVRKIEIWEKDELVETILND